MRRLVFLLLLTALVACAQVKLFQSPNTVFVEIDGKPFTALYYGGDHPKPYLHPLKSAEGTVVTRGFPMENIAGETKDHPHHRGVWLGYGFINGFNFWENESAYKETNKGTVVPSKPPKLKSDGKVGVITGYYDWLNPEGSAIMNETREMTFYLHKTLRVIDFDVLFTAQTKVEWGDTKEGFFAIRIATELQEAKGTGHMVNAQGQEGEKLIWGKPSEWVDYSGTVGKEKVGIAIFDHPSNLNFPTRWHARAYGLFAANPFGKAEFEGAKGGGRGTSAVPASSYVMQPGQTLRLRYRIVVHPGDTKSADIAKLYADWTKGKRP
ncbi:MAG: PmoA family protein [Bryobacteraceae bacterium]